MIWIQENILALYGAIVGTVALFLNFGRFWFMYQKNKRKLKVVSRIDKGAQDRLASLEKPDGGLSSRGALCGPIYKVDVINTSHLQMHIHDAGIIFETSSGKEKIKVLVRGERFLNDLDESGGKNIPAGSRESFSVWLKSDGITIPKVVGCYVEDQLGKEYKGKHEACGIVLRQPTVYKTPSS